MDINLLIDRIKQSKTIVTVILASLATLGSLWGLNCLPGNLPASTPSVQVNK